MTAGGTDTPPLILAMSDGEWPEEAGAAEGMTHSDGARLKCRIRILDESGRSRTRVPK